jgi:FAD/FMN-containing dehydrogenase
MAEVVGVFGAPVKFDVSLPLSEIANFEGSAGALIARHAPHALPLLFGHIGEGNLHLNILRCTAESEARIYPEMMELIAGHGGNVSSEHGVGTLKRAYLTMSRRPADIAVMRTIKEALDPTGYLNPAVLFD